MDTIDNVEGVNFYAVDKTDISLSKPPSPIERVDDIQIFLMKNGFSLDAKYKENEDGIAELVCKEIWFNKNGTCMVELNYEDDFNKTYVSAALNVYVQTIKTSHYKYNGEPDLRKGKYSIGNPDAAHPILLGAEFLKENRYDFMVKPIRDHRTQTTIQHQKIIVSRIPDFYKALKALIGNKSLVSFPADWLEECLPFNNNLITAHYKNQSGMVNEYGLRGNSMIDPSSSVRNVRQMDYVIDFLEHVSLKMGHDMLWSHNDLEKLKNYITYYQTEEELSEDKLRLPSDERLPATRGYLEMMSLSCMIDDHANDKQVLLDFLESQSPEQMRELASFNQKESLYSLPSLMAEALLYLSPVHVSVARNVGFFTKVMDIFENRCPLDIQWDPQLPLDLLLSSPQNHSTLEALAKARYVIDKSLMEVLNKYPRTWVLPEEHTYYRYHGEIGGREWVSREKVRVKLTDEESIQKFVLEKTGEQMNSTPIFEKQLRLIFEKEINTKLIAAKPKDNKFKDTLRF